jgi:hypothetical protein
VGPHEGAGSSIGPRLPASSVVVSSAGGCQDTSILPAAFMDESVYSSARSRVRRVLWPQARPDKRAGTGHGTDGDGRTLAGNLCALPTELAITQKRLAGAAQGDDCA